MRDVFSKFWLKVMKSGDLFRNLDVDGSLSSIYGIPVGFLVVGEIVWRLLGPMACLFEQDHKPSGSIKCREFLSQPRVC
jgi:hypothetical protein